jgi:AcrR family transcriptional regulator
MPSSAKKGTQPSRPRRARGSINAVDIIAGAFDFFQDTPVEQWSIPQLAAHLDVGVTTIYWYFKSKRELLEAMTNRALASFYESMPPLRGDCWENLLRDFFVDFYTLLSADELKCDLIVRQIGTPSPVSGLRSGGPMQRSWPRADELFERMMAAGVPPSVVQHAFFTLSIYTQGFLLVERTGRAAEPISFAGGIDPSAEAANVDPAQARKPSTDFEFGITNIIRGLQPLVPQTDRTELAG